MYHVKQRVAKDMTSFAIDMGEEKGYSASSTQGCQKQWFFENLASSGTSNSQKPVLGLLGKSVTTLCEFLQLRDRMGHHGTLWDEHRGRGRGSAESIGRRVVDLRQPYANRGLIAEVYANLG
jgi:hypothetical protein